MTFMAFSLIGIAGSSWIGAIVMGKVYPRFAGNPHFQEFMTFSGWRIKRELEYSETLAHTVGLATHEVTGHIFDKLFEHVWPEEDQESAKKRDGALLALASNIDAGGIGSFKTLLDSVTVACQ